MPSIVKDRLKEQMIVEHSPTIQIGTISSQGRREYDDNMGLVIDGHKQIVSLLEVEPTDTLTDVCYEKVNIIVSDLNVGYNIHKKEWKCMARDKSKISGGQIDTDLHN